MPPNADTWRSRIDTLLADDERVATRILEEIDLTPEKAKAFVRTVTPSGIFDLKPDAPKPLRDAAHPASYALQLLCLSDAISAADPQAIQLGRLWGRLGLGMQAPDVVKASQTWWLNQNRGPGGRKDNDLTATLKELLREIPDASFEEAVSYLFSEDLLDRYHSTEDKTAFITNVEELPDDEGIGYTDTSGTFCKIKVASLKRRLRELKAKGRNSTS